MRVDGQMRCCRQKRCGVALKDGELVLLSLSVRKVMVDESGERKRKDRMNREKPRVGKEGRPRFFL